MSSTPRDDAYTLDMLQSAERVACYLAGVTFKSFEADPVLQDAVIRRLEIIGEAARRVSTRYADAHDTVPWRDAIDMRNLLAHEYDVVSLGIVWETALVDLPELADSLRAVLGDGVRHPGYTR